MVRIAHFRVQLIGMKSLKNFAYQRHLTLKIEKRFYHLKTKSGARTSLSKLLQTHKLELLSCHLTLLLVLVLKNNLKPNKKRFIGTKRLDLIQAIFWQFPMTVNFLKHLSTTMTLRPNSVSKFPIAYESNSNSSRKDLVTTFQQSFPRCGLTIWSRV